MGFSRQEYWSVLPFPPPGDLPHPGVELVSPALAGRYFTTDPSGNPDGLIEIYDNYNLSVLFIFFHVLFIVSSVTYRLLCAFLISYSCQDWMTSCMFFLLLSNMLIFLEAQRIFFKFCNTFQCWLCWFDFLRYTVCSFESSFQVIFFFFFLSFTSFAYLGTPIKIMLDIFIFF